MEGSLAKLPEIVELAKKHNAITVVDDSHGTGVMGKTGRGTIEHYGLEGQIDVITGTLGKALGGAAGGFVAGSRALIDMLIQRSRPQLFSNALPATVACSSLAAIEYLEAHPELMDHLREKIAYFRSGLLKLGYEPLEGESAIIPIIVGDTAFAIALSDKLLQKGVFVTGFGYPVVPEGTARIRVQMSAKLTKEEMDHALAAFDEVGHEVGVLKRGVPAYTYSKSQRPWYARNEDAVRTVIGRGSCCIGAVGAVGFLHTLVPDHWAPIAVMARRQGWIDRQTMGAAATRG